MTSLQCHLCTFPASHMCNHLQGHPEPMCDEHAAMCHRMGHATTKLNLTYPEWRDRIHDKWQETDDVYEVDTEDLLPDDG